MNWSAESLLNYISGEFGGEEALKLYKNFLFSENRRFEEKIKTASLGLLLSRDETLPATYRAASFVIFCYKSIEEDQRAVLVEVFNCFTEFELILQNNLDYNVAFSGIRDDCRQVYLSLLTVKWHVEILIGSSPAKTFDRVLDFSERVSAAQGNITLTQNIGRALLLYSYFLFFHGRERESRYVIGRLWHYFCSSMDSISKGSMPSSSHVGDFCKLSEYIQCAAAGIEWMDDTRKRNNLWGKRKILGAVVRVKAEDGHGFNQSLERLFSKEGRYNEFY